MELAQALGICPGVTAIIGGGGKTTLLYALAEQLGPCGRVIVCTTTHLFPPTHLPCLIGGGEAELRAALEQAPVVCAGTPAAEGKLTIPAVPMEALARLADFVLVEADGAKHLPLKAHAAWEPVVPPEANQTILVLGVRGFGRPIRDAAHRPELYAQRLGVTEDTLVTPELAARLVQLERLHSRVLVNQVETDEEKMLAKRLAAGLSCPVSMAALQKGWLACLC